MSLRKDGLAPEALETLQRLKKHPLGAAASFTFANDPGTKAQLLRLREQFQETGALHEATAMQLRLLPFTIDPRLDNPDGVVANVRPAQPGADGRYASGVVEYLWKATGVKASWRPDRVYSVRLAHLCKWVQFLLGENWKVSVSLNGRNLASGGHKPRNAAAKRTKRRRRS